MKGRIAFGRWHFNLPAKWSWSASWRIIRSRTFWLRTAVFIAVLLIATSVLGASIMPGNPLYPMKRLGESVLTALTPNINYQHVKVREGVRAIYAARRLNEAAAMVERLDKRSVKKQVSDADTIEALLQQFNEVFSDLTVARSQQIDRGEHPSAKIFTDIQRRSTELLVKLVHLRLEAPPSDQAVILRSIVIVNSNLAAIADILGQPPVSKDDAVELSKIVSVGLISKDDLNGLMGQANSNRRLLDLLRERVKSGQLPTGIIYAMNYDLVTKLLPKEAPEFIHTVRFDELRKVALLMKTIEPTPTQKKAIDDYLKSYKVGDLIPTNSITRYTAPLIYGWHLVETMGVDTSKLNPEHMSPERRIFYDLWSPVLGKISGKPQAKGSLLNNAIPTAFAQSSTTSQTTTTPTYDQVMSMANVGMIKTSALLDRVQLELLKALRSEVAYMALPPGWTATDVSSMSGDFAESVDNLRSAEAVQAKTNQAVTALASVTQPLQQSLANDEADKLRSETKTAIEQLRTQLVQNVYNSTFVTNNTTAPVTITEATVSIDDKLAVLTEQFNKSLTDLEAKLNTQSATDKAAIKSELDELKKDFAASTKALKDSQALLEDQAKAQATLLSATQTKIKELEAGQGALAKDIADARAEASDANRAMATKMDNAVATIRQTQAEDIAVLRNQLNGQATRADELELSLISLTQAQLEQKTVLQAEIELSATDRAALKTQIETAVAELKAEQAKNITDLQVAISAAEARGDAKITEAKQSINELKTTQLDTLKSLQTLGSDQDTLKSQVTAAIATLESAQDTINSKIQTLATNQTNLTATVQSLASDQETTYKQLQAMANETALLRADLEKVVTDLTAAQVASAQDLNAAILALGSQLSQSIATVSAAASQTQASLELVEAKTVTLDVALAGIAQANAEANANLEAELAETKAIQDSLAQSLTALSQALSQTAGEVATLQTDVSQIKQSITDITNTQLAAQTQIDSLVSASVDWADTAASIKVDVAALEKLQTDLEASFTTKSAQLQAQFESYQQQLNAGLDRLTSHTDEQVLRLQEETERLKQLLEQAAMTAATTTANTATTTPTVSPIASPSVSVETSVAPVVSSPVASETPTIPGL